MAELIGQVVRRSGLSRLGRGSTFYWIGEPKRLYGGREDTVTQPRPYFPLYAAPFTLALLACAGGDDASAERTLREAFPDHAALVLESAPPSDGADARAGLSGVFPEQGNGIIRFSLKDGFEVRVREEGVQGDREPAGEAISYRREGGLVFWTKTRVGFEEWLLLDPGQARSERAAASWTLEGAEARQHGDVILVVNPAGEAKLRIAAPASFAASGRIVPTKLVAVSSSRIDLYVDGGGEQVLVDPSWSPSNSLIAPRDYGAMVPLVSGEVLLAGGEGFSSVGVAMTEIYDWKTNAWLPAGSLAEPPSHATMTLLPSGKALLAGGYWKTGSKTVPLATTQLFNPASKTWAVGPPMKGPRAFHGAVRLPNGKVFVAGGSDGKNRLASAEIYDPVANVWTPVAPMNVARSSPEATLLLSGNVLVTNGSVDGVSLVATKVVEIYNPASNTWSMAAPTSRAHLQHQTLLLPDGRVLLAGWFDWNDPDNPNAKPDDAEIYDPATNTWKNSSLMPRRAGGVTLTLLKTKKVLLTHWELFPQFASFAQLYDYEKDLWTITKPPALFHRDGHATLLDNDKVLFVGSEKADFAEVYNPGTPLGTACSIGDDCESDICVDGICCDTPCDGGACWACSIANGAPSDGVCAELTGLPCDDGDACSIKDACGPGGVCSGTPRSCEAIDECHEIGACNPDHGLCESPPKADGSPCSGGGVCVKGHCTPAASATSSGASGGPPGDPSLPGTCGCRVQGAESQTSPGVLSLALLLGALARRRGRRRAAHVR
jgi:MYXO-CTERM domain-containing protein